ncbi:hypothetical protein M011DRAFT_467551 [Sporormia fimetaria CBS 119925]|uniref:Uncharacterized protein n=1 Tax=Sporormia fimetaria CBS 119925 TaxID=1340428 RepID=A0A6A6VA28_9PLEO|nr:hypothetical protein M011DRAFT_467551 [Sporormia fimetaria CBS 119925]
MSGPYRFQPDSVPSPLDRQSPNLYSAGQAPNFKTNVNRMKTKKWVEAKKNAYDGDDWGEYDEYDEYGADANPSQPPLPAGYRQPAQGLDQPYRSFTDPHQAAKVQGRRRNSFEAGEEHRAFSATYAPPRPGASRQVSGAESDVSYTPQNRRDFSPSAMPPPLHTKMPMEHDGTRPPRKSSLDHTTSPPPISPSGASPTSQKPLPFIRPADIYRRIEEERRKERASMESTRPSLDAIEQDAKREPLEPVAERKSEYFPNSSAMQGTQQQYQQPGQPLSPPNTTLEAPGISAFDNDFWSSGPQVPALGGPVPSTSRTEEPGLRAVVEHAFTRTDDQRSVPPTPASKDSDAEVSRSNTVSSTGISPIMSGVPSTATSAMKGYTAGPDSSTPVILEEGSGRNTPILEQIPKGQSGGHSRNVSTSSLATPTAGSPARSPVVTPQKVNPVPESAILASALPDTDPPMSFEANAQPSSYAAREADIALALRKSPPADAASLGAAEKNSQAAFLASHPDAQSPVTETAPRSRSESPSKGRVHELAGKFGEVSHSRRGSTQSNASSVQSWERSRENSRPSSPTKTSRPSSPTKQAQFSERPPVNRDPSFRPKLPGQWESFATTIPTPSEKENVEEPVGPKTSTEIPPPSPLETVDLTPTTAKHTVEPAPPSETESDPLAMLKAAGAAVGDAIQSSIGIKSGAMPEDAGTEKEEGRHFVGDIYLSQPLHLERTASSVASSVPPTPPAKDSPEAEELPPPPPLKEWSPEPKASSSQLQTPTRPPMIPQLSTEPSEHDLESDRLRKEIVASLSPEPLRPKSRDDGTLLLPTVSATTNRDSSVLPMDYDSYWATGPTSTSAQDVAGAVSEADRPEPPAAGQSPYTEHAAPGPGLLTTRFSWEDRTSGAMSPEGQAHAGATAGPGTTSQDVEVTGTDMGPQPAAEPGPQIAPALAGPSNDVKVAVQAATPPSGPAIEAPELQDSKIASPVSGLHVVNSETDSEAVDMPPRYSYEAATSNDAPGYNQAESLVSGHAQNDHVGEQRSTEPVQFPAASEPTQQSATSTGKPLGFRDILNIKTSSERIVSYNKTRDYWAKADHGLDNWISSTLKANPELANQPIAPPQPQVARTSTARHRATGSLSLFGRHHHASANSQSNIMAPAEQSNISSSYPAPGPSSVAASPDNARHSQRLTSHQMQAKGKDLLHTAGVLGGKGMTGAKGLFAKGKSRFRGGGDKVEK